MSIKPAITFYCCIWRLPSPWLVSDLMVISGPETFEEQGQRQCRLVCTDL